MKKLLFGLLLIMGCAAPVVVKPIELPEYEADTSLAAGISSATVALVHREEKFSDGSYDGIYRPFCTGVWVSENHILTARHCVVGLMEAIGYGREIGMKIEFIQHDQVVDIGENVSSRWMGSVVGINKKMDLALIQVSHHDHHGIAGLALQSPGMGAHLAMIGHVKGLYWTYVEGVVSSYRRKMKVDSEMTGPYMQVSAPISLGNSGGGAFNLNGQLVGIVSFVSGAAPNAAFYIPLGRVREFLLANGIK